MCFFPKYLRHSANTSLMNQNVHKPLSYVIYRPNHLPRVCPLRIYSSSQPTPHSTPRNYTDPLIFTQPPVPLYQSMSVIIKMFSTSQLPLSQCSEISTNSFPFGLYYAGRQFIQNDSSELQPPESLLLLPKPSGMVAEDAQSHRDCSLA